MSDTRSNPYAAPTSTIVASASTDPTRKAERVTRLVAKILDNLIALPATLPLVIGVQLMLGGSNTAGLVLVLIGGIALIALLAFQIRLLLREQQTLGKRWQGIRIVRADGERIGFGRILGLRMIAPAIVSMIPFVGAVFGLANILWIFGEERRCLHDYFADTIVVNA